MPVEGYYKARPRSLQEIDRLPSRPDVLAAAEEKGVKNVVHFTTISGVTGVLWSQAVKSRALLPEDKYLEYVYKPNAATRERDEEWIDYVNLSVERINDRMFGFSTKWHVKDGVSWVVLSFQPSILAHPGVVFTTTNNIYSSCQRAEGLPGFEMMFNDTMREYDGTLHDRSDKRANWPTNRQAEVLYPGELSTDYLQRIDVQLEEKVDTVNAILDVLGMDVPVRYAPEVFR